MKPLHATLLALSLLPPAAAVALDRDAALGGAIGGGVGAAIGSEVGGREGAIVGGGVGAAIGTAIATDRSPAPRGRPVPYPDGDHGEGGRAERRYEAPYPVGRPAIPPGHMPPPGLCRIWYPGRPPGHQPPPGDCRQLWHRMPYGAWLVQG